MKQRSGMYPAVQLDAAGAGVVSQAGAVALTETVRVSGLDAALREALASWRKPTAVHEPAKVLLDWRWRWRSVVSTSAGTARSSGTQRAVARFPTPQEVHPSRPLLVVEAKPATATKGIARGPAQVSFYAAMWAAWLSSPQASPDSLEEELTQRAMLGLPAPPQPARLSEPLRVVPVLAIGPGTVSDEAWPRLRSVANAVAGAVPTIEPLEVLVLDGDGGPTRWRWQDPDAAPPRTVPEHEHNVPYAQRAPGSACLEGPSTRC